MYGSMYPRLDSKSEEGKRVWKLSLEIERDPKLARETKALNRERNDGAIVCEACRFSDSLDSMFDAHHVQPLAAGVRQSRVDDFVVLCPTCHRWAHAKARKSCHLSQCRTSLLLWPNDENAVWG
jgi:5-methylcytosine-specific restriction protein A